MSIDGTDMTYMSFMTLRTSGARRRSHFTSSNQFIHAYTSFVARDESRNWSDVYVVSDYDRNDCIWRVPVSEIRRLFNVTAQDYPHSVHLVYNHEKGDYDVSMN